jgi:translation initiation factor 2 subunit 2
MEELPLIDFSKVKKKRHIIKLNLEKNNEIDDLSDIIIMKKTNKKTSEDIFSNSTEQKILSTLGPLTNQDYSYEFLLNRVKDFIKSNNPNLGDKEKVSIPAPQMFKVGTKRTAWVNFSEVCNSLKRPTEHLYNYITSELGVEGSLGGECQFLIRGMFKNKHIESLLRNYFREYVLCSICKNSSTILKKDNTTRLQVMNCSTCGSERTVQPIKARVNRN